MNGNSNTGQGINTSTAVLQGGLQPFQLQLDLNKQRQEEQAKKEKIRAAQKAARDKTISNLMEWSPDTAYEPYDEQVRNLGQTHVRDWVVEQINQFGDQIVNDPQFLSNLKNRQEYANTYAAKSNQIKDIDTKNRARWKADENIDESKAISLQNDIIYNDDLSGKDLTELDLTAIKDIDNNPDIYNKEAIAKRIVEGLPEMINKFYTQKNNEYGEEYYEIREIKRNMLSRELGPTGMPKPIITDEFVTLVKQDPYVQKILDKDERDDREVLKEMFGPYAQYEESITPGRRIVDPDRPTSGERADQREATSRFESIKRAIEGNVGELERMENGDTSQGKIENVKYSNVEGLKYPYVAVGVRGKEAGRRGGTETTRRSINFNLNIPEEREAFARFYAEALTSKEGVRDVDWDNLRPLMDEYQSELSSQDNERMELGNEMGQLFNE